MIDFFSLFDNQDDGVNVIHVTSIDYDGYYTDKYVDETVNNVYNMDKPSVVAKVIYECFFYTNEFGGGYCGNLDKYRFVIAYCNQNLAEKLYDVMVQVLITHSIAPMDVHIIIGENPNLSNEIIDKLKNINMIKNIGYKVQLEGLYT